jgi:hypothetical protein
MREESLARLEAVASSFSTNLHIRYVLGLLSPSEAAEAIAAPARSCGVSYAPSALESLLNDLTRGPGPEHHINAVRVVELFDCGTGWPTASEKEAVSSRNKPQA